MTSIFEKIGAPPIPQVQVIEALQAELQECGGLMNLFDEQQNAILARNPDAVLDYDEKIKNHLLVVRSHRKHREAVVTALATSNDQPPQTTITELIPLFRESVRPLLQALITEVNRLITRGRRRAEQNQMLLARTIEVTQGILARLHPATVTRTYSAQGRMKISASNGASRLIVKS